LLCNTDDIENEKCESLVIGVVEGFVAMFTYFFVVLNIESILKVTKKPPNMFIDAIIIAKKLKNEISEKLVDEPSAMIAPTIITPEIAFVTDIRGV
jgi:hypothetical protein